MGERFTVDDLARRLPLGRPARRIVSIAPNATECLLAIGAASRLVGVEEHSELPADLADLPRVGGFKNVDFERILALAPDLVVAASLHAVTVAPVLEARGVPVFVQLPRTVDGVVDGMARLAAAAGLARAAAHYLALCRARIAAVVAKALLARCRPLVYVELSPDGHSGGPPSFVDDLVTRAGGVNLGGIARVEWPVIATETVRRLDPEVIVIAGYPGSATRELVFAREGWDRVSAVKAGRVYELPARMLKRPGPGVLDGLERLAAILTAVREGGEAGEG